ncbi:MAG: MFS transporter [Synergistales bacterium]|nr:MFS transporter [Synergistales bacterium]
MGQPQQTGPYLPVIVMVTLIAVMGVASVTPVFPSLARALSIRPERTGLLITCFTLPGIVLAPLAGLAADVVGRKRILIPALALFALAGAGCFFTDRFAHILALRFLQGIGAAPLPVVNLTIMGDLFNGRRLNRSMGINASLLSVGTATYPAIGGALGMLGWNAPFLLPLAALPVALMVAAVLPERAEGMPWSRAMQHAREGIGTLGREELLLYLISVLLFVNLYGVALSYIPFLVERNFGGTAVTVGLFMSGVSAGTVVAASQLGRLMACSNVRRLLAAAFALVLSAVLVLPAMPSLWLALIPGLALGTAQGIAVPCTQARLAGIASQRYRGVTMAFLGAALRIGQTVGPVLMGGAYVLCGMWGPFLAGGGIAVLGLVLVVAYPVHCEAE